MFARKNVSGRGLFARGLSLTAAVLMLGTLAACSGGGEPSSTASGTNPSSKYGEIELPDMNVTNSKLRMLQPDETLVNPAKEYLEGKYGITEVETVYVPPEEVQTKLVNSLMSNDYFDLYFSAFSPALILGGYVEPFEIDMDNALWADVQDENEQFMWKGERYHVVPSFKYYNMVYYNKSMFDEAGETYPTELFDKGEWDWNKMLELAETLTIDSNRDGTPEQYGLGFDEPEHLLYTTGKHFYTFMPDGTLRNNIQSPEVARAVAFNVKLLQSKTLVPSAARQTFGEGSVAMCIGHLWYASGYGKLVRNDEIGVAPLPRDPDADDYYTELEGDGIYIPKNAPNKEGAVAAMHAFRYTMLSKKYRESMLEKDIEKGTWSEELQEQMEKSMTLKSVLRNWGTIDITDHWGDLWSRPNSGEPWETIAAELAPVIDARIKELYGN